MMTNQLLRQMRQSELPDDANVGFGAGTFTETTDIELARVLASGGSLGLAAALSRALERQAMPELDGQAADRPAPAGLPASQGAIQAVLYRPLETSEGLAVPLPVRAPVSSHFGWRQDPFGAGLRFHNGVDLAAEEGREVDAVAGGRVAFAGEAPGYGNTVVIEHAGGASTRYAHLSAVDVRAGELVQAGQAIGNVGQTGRSTGPHLHFELWQDGRPVNPEQAAARFALALKTEAVVAD